MGTLCLKRVTKAVEDTSFSCGISSIDNYVKNESYFPHIAQHAYAYCVMADDVVLGYYQVLFREIELADFPEDIAEIDPNIKDGKISAVHIRYIAIDSNFQGNGIGTGTLKTIIKDVEELSNLWPIRVITIDARVELVDWYKKVGFVKMINNSPGQEGQTVRMYFDCMKFSGELAAYIEDWI